MWRHAIETIDIRRAGVGKSTRRRLMRRAGDDRDPANVHTGAELVPRCAVKTAGGEFRLLRPDGSDAGKDVSGARVVINVGPTQILATGAYDNRVAFDGHGVVGEDVVRFAITRGEFLLLAPLIAGVANKDVGRPGICSFIVVARC